VLVAVLSVWCAIQDCLGSPVRTDVCLRILGAHKKVKTEERTEFRETSKFENQKMLE
jgi:hypothetical protein